jgi:predicted DNA-binding transcriptional regulator AlpA
MQEIAPHSGGLVDAAAVARYLGCKRSWVYENADWLGARPLGLGPKPRLRFSLAEVDARLRERATCSTGRGSESGVSSVVEPIRRRRRSTDLGTGIRLLRIRGRRPP